MVLLKHLFKKTNIIHPMKQVVMLLQNFLKMEIIIVHVLNLIHQQLNYIQFIFLIMEILMKMSQLIIFIHIPMI